MLFRNETFGMFQAETVEHMHINVIKLRNFSERITHRSQPLCRNPLQRLFFLLPKAACKLLFYEKLARISGLCAGFWVIRAYKSNFISLTY
jgi:hypothetical protein